MREKANLCAVENGFEGGGEEGGVLELGLADEFRNRHRRLRLHPRQIYAFGIARDNLTSGVLPIADNTPSFIIFP